MLRLLILSFLLLPSLSLAHWDFVKLPVKSDFYQSHVLIREVPIGKTRQLAAVLQNSKISAKLYPDFSKVQADDVAKYLLKSFSPNFEKEMLENVSLYRTQTDVDHIRLMVKKRKNDFLISFAFVKKTFLYRSYNETDFFQRLFIASENKKAAEGKTSRLFNIPTLVMSQTAQAAAFSFNMNDLLGSINSLSGKVKPDSLNNLVFATQNIEPGLNRLADAFTGGVTQLERGVRAAEALPNAADRLNSGITAGARGIESGLNRISDTMRDPKVWLAGGALFQAGTMFSNIVALGINHAFSAIRDILYDSFNLFKPGEKEKILQQAASAWQEYHGLSQQMHQREKEIQNIEIALQLAAGKSIEEIYQTDDKKLSESGRPLSLMPGKSIDNACVPSILPSKSEIENLRSLADSIKNSPEVQEKLCERLNSNMDMIEALSDELTNVRTRISNSMMDTYNTIYSNKLSALMAPQTMGKSIKECATNAETEIKADKSRYERWNCSRTPSDERCMTLKEYIEQTEKDIAECSNKGKVILARDDDQYINTRRALRASKKRMDETMSDFLLADCDANKNLEYCKGKDGVATGVKKLYNANLEKLKNSQCPKLKAERFGLATPVQQGNLPAQQSMITPVTGTLTSADGIDSTTRLPASSAAAEPPKENFIQRGWNGFWEGIKSIFSWFKR